MKKIIFKQDTECEAEMMSWYAVPGKGYSPEPRAFSSHPKLPKLIKKSGKTNHGEVTKIVIKHLNRYYKDNQAKIDKSQKNIEKHWRKIEGPILQLLYKTLEYDQKDTPKASCIVGTISIFPRLLNEKTFFVSYQFPVRNTMWVIAHEYTHFLYFDKWFEIFPNDTINITRYPHILWQLSELLAVILTSDEEILKYIPEAKDQFRNYIGTPYNELIIPEKNISVEEYFRNLYVKHKKAKTSIEQFFIKCRKEIVLLDKKMELSTPGKYSD